LKKNERKPWVNKQWGMPPDANAEFVCAMEDILAVSHRPYSPDNPLVCRDESSKQQVMETRKPIEAAPGQIAR
jgi:hypothetical protein